MIDRFWANVDVRGPDECWPWMRACYWDDYGLLNVGQPGRRTTMRAHVFALILETGEDSGGRFGLHSCDNPPCCNPAHLRWGDHDRNMLDMAERERIAIGTRNGRAKLTEVDVVVIRQRYAAGERQRDIAASYDVGQSVISDACRGRTWAHVS